MDNKVKSVVGIGIIILLVILYYWYAGSQLGISLSCENKKILEIVRIPPPLMAVFQPTICQVELKASVNNLTLCSGKIKINNYEKGVFPCPTIKDYPNKSIKISAVFYNADGNQEIEKDNASLEYNPR